MLRHVDLAFAQAAEQLVRRQIDQFDFVRRLEEGVGDRFVDTDTGDLADDVVETFQMLHVQRRVDVDSRRKELVNILPAFRMTRARRVGVGQFVDQKQRRSPSQRLVEIEFLDRRALDVEHQRRQLRKLLQHRRSLDATMRLEQANDHVDAGAAQRVRRRKHRVRLADTGRGAEEYFQPAAAIARFSCAHFGEQRIGVRALGFHAAVV